MDSANSSRRLTEDSAGHHYPAGQNVPSLLSQSDSRIIRMLDPKIRLSDELRLAEIVELYNKGEDINAVDLDGRSPLMIAASDKSYIEITKFLIANGGDVNAYDDGGETPLHYAVKGCQNIETINFLVQQGCDTNKLNNSGDSPLCLAAANPYVFPNIKALLDGGGMKSINSRNGRGHTPAEIAISAKSKVGLYYLFQSGANLPEELTPKIKEDLMRIAVAFQDRHTLNVCLSKYPVPDMNFATNVRGDTLLHDIARLPENQEIIEMLIDKGVDIHRLNTDGETPLHIAARREENEGNLNCLLRHSARDQINVLRLNIAARVGDLSTVQMLLKDGMDYRWENHYGSAAIHEAVKGRDTRIVSCLCKAGADVNVQNADGHCALHMAVIQNDLTMVDFLIATCGADINMISAENKTALYIAVEHSHLDIIDRLLQAPDIDVDHADKSQNSPLCIAVKSHNITATQKLCAAGSRIDIGGRGLALPLYEAVRNGYLDIVKCIFDHATCKHFNMTGIYGETLLHVAAQNDRSDILAYLLTEQNDKFDVNQLTSPGASTALMEAVSYSGLELCKLLCSKSANVNLADSLGNTALHLAAEGGFLDKVKLLCRLNANVNMMNHAGQTPLAAAAMKGRLECVKYLLTLGNVAINRSLRNMDAPLHCAIRKGCVEVVDLFIAAGADTNQRTIEVPLLEPPQSVIMAGDNTRLMTALHLAVINHSDKSDLLQSLIKQSYTDINLPCLGGNGNTPLHEACSIKDADVAYDCLMTAGANTEVLNTDKDTPLHVAVRHGNEARVAALLNASCRIDAVNAQGETALHLAAKRPDVKCMFLLLKAGAAIDHLGPDQTTPRSLLDTAVIEGRINDNDLTELLESIPEETPQRGIPFNHSLMNKCRRVVRQTLRKEYNIIDQLGLNQKQKSYMKGLEATIVEELESKKPSAASGNN